MVRAVDGDGHSVDDVCCGLASPEGAVVLNVVDEKARVVQSLSDARYSAALLLGQAQPLPSSSRPISSQRIVLDGAVRGALTRLVEGLDEHDSYLLSLHLANVVEGRQQILSICRTTSQRHTT